MNKEEKRTVVCIAKFYANGVESRVFRLTDAEIKQKKAEGYLVKEYLNHYRPGFYTKQKEFVAAPGKMF